MHPVPLVQRIFRTFCSVNTVCPARGLLQDFLESLGMSQAAFAEKIGWTKARLNELIRGSVA